LDFKSGTKRGWQMRLCIKFAVIKLLPRQFFCLPGEAFRLIQLLGSQRCPGHPGKPFDIFRSISLLRAIGGQFRIGAGKIVLR